MLFGSRKKEIKCVFLMPQDMAPSLPIPLVWLGGPAQQNRHAYVQL